MKNEIEKEKNEADMNKLNWNPRYVNIFVIICLANMYT